jgi:hypothetical protein
MTSNKVADRLLTLVELAFRRSAGGKIASVGLVILGLIWGANLFISLNLDFAGRGDVRANVQSADMPDWLKWGGTTLAAILICIGCGMIHQTWRAEHKTRDRRRVIGVEIRGLIDTTDTPLINAVPVKIHGQRREILLDIRAQIIANTPAQLNDALKHISCLSRDLKLEKSGRAREDLNVFVGGLAPVPFLFLAGMLLDDESQATLLDWKRDEGQWNALAESGDSYEIVAATYPIKIDREVVLAVSLSYKIQHEVIEKCWPHLPVVVLALERQLPDKTWSEAQQKSVGNAFLETIAQLQNRGVQRIHLALASSASLSIRLGRLYDRRNLPELLVYQYEKTNEIPYPWAIQMATHGISEAQLVFAS